MKRTSEDITELPVERMDVDRVPLGTKARLRLTVASSTVLPAFVVAGERPGSTVMMVAGVHGDEFEGMQALREVYALVQPSEMRGRVFGIPICNMWAYRAKARASPREIDGLDLARVFPGTRGGSPTQRLAHALFELVMRNLTENDLFVDLHSGGTRYAYLPLAGFRGIANPSRMPSEEAARHAQHGRIWQIDATPGAFNSETASRGVVSVGCEVHGQGGLRADDVRLYVRTLANLLRFKGVLPGDKPTRDNSRAVHLTKLRAATSGFVAGGLDLGRRVEEGELVSQLIDEHGEVVDRIVSSMDGQVYAARTFPHTDAGDVVCLIGAT